MAVEPRAPYRQSLSNVVDHQPGTSLEVRLRLHCSLLPSGRFTIGARRRVGKTIASGRQIRRANSLFSGPESLSPRGFLAADLTIRRDFSAGPRGKFEYPCPYRVLERNSRCNPAPSPGHERRFSVNRLHTAVWRRFQGGNHHLNGVGCDSPENHGSHRRWGEELAGRITGQTALARAFGKNPASGWSRGRFCRGESWARRHWCGFAGRKPAPGWFRSRASAANRRPSGLAADSRRASRPRAAPAPRYPAQIRQNQDTLPEDTSISAPWTRP